MRKLTPLLVCIIFFSIGCISNPSQIVQIITPTANGSGFVVGETSTSWIVATAAHVCTSPSIEVKVDKDGNYQVDIFDVPLDHVLVEGEVSRVIARHATEDVVLIEMPKRVVSGIRLRSFKVWALADAEQGERTVAYGVVRLPGYESQVVEYHGWVVCTNWRGYVATNGGVYPGCSGGPVVSRGRVIGVMSRYEDVRGQLDTATTLAVPASAVREMLKEIGL